MRRIDRRQLLQVGSVGMLGLSLPALLQANPYAAGQRSASGKPRSCIFIHLYGGPSQLDTWDMKPDAPAEVRGPYKPIATATPGLQITELMPKLARQSQKFALMRSLRHHESEHSRANTIMLTGHTRPEATTPCFGAIMSKVRPATRNIPSYVFLQKFGGGAKPPDHAFLTGGFLGPNCAPLLIGKQGSINDEGPHREDFKVSEFDAPKDISAARLAERRQLLARLDTPPSAIKQRAASLERYQERAFELVTGNDARQAFDVNRENPVLRDRYGRHPLGQNLLLARRLIEAGVRLVSVCAWTGLAPEDKSAISIETWDMHGNGGPIFGVNWNGLGWAVPCLDQALSTLLEDLGDRGRLDDTLVVAVGEFGRSPKINGNAKGPIGRDHWPHCYTGLLAGSGVRGGVVHGATDQQAGYVKDDPVSPEDFAATVFRALDVPLETRLGADGFTHPVSTGTPVEAIF